MPSEVPARTVTYDAQFLWSQWITPVNEEEIRFSIVPKLLASASGAPLRRAQAMNNNLPTGIAKEITA